MPDVPQVTRAPAAFAAAFARLNHAIARLWPLTRLEAGPGLTITRSQTNVLVALAKPGAGGGLPAGVTFRPITLCTDEGEIQVWIATWDEDPS
jgi:hypothetical protein